MTSSKPSDSTLTQDRSPEAFQDVVERYHERLFKVILRIVKNRSDAEEVIQDTFLKAYRKLDSFQADSSLYTWLYRIAVNAAVDLSKKRRRRQHLSFDDEELSLDGLVPSLTAAPDADPEQQELNDLVRQGIHALPERYRVILILREYSDMSYEQLGEVLKLPKGTVESRLFRARAKLKDWLIERFAKDGLAPEAFGF